MSGLLPLLLFLAVAAAIMAGFPVAFTLAGMALVFAGLGALRWHAHEMIFGYGMAVVAGFLLTAVGNWTGMQTVRGTRLLLLFMAWLVFGRGGVA
mgnify:CR=1 FL=1